MHIQASTCTQLLVQFKFLLPSLRARRVNLVSLIKAFKAQSYKNILCVSVWGMSLAVGSIYLPWHLVSLLKSLRTATLGFLKIFNKGQANNMFRYWAFPSLALLRVSCRDNYPAPLLEFQWSLLLQHLSLSWQITLFPWLRTISGPKGARRGWQLAARPWAETVREREQEKVRRSLFHELLSLLKHLAMCTYLNMSNAWKSHHFDKIPFPLRVLFAFLFLFRVFLLVLSLWFFVGIFFFPTCYLVHFQALASLATEPGRIADVIV